MHPVLSVFSVMRLEVSHKPWMIFFDSAVSTQPPVYLAACQREVINSPRCSFFGWIHGWVILYNQDCNEHNRLMRSQ